MMAFDRRTTIVNALAKLLSSPMASIVIISVAIANRFVQLIYFSYLGGDRAHQALAAQNLLDGHGVTISRVFSSDLSNIIYEPLIKWPPGYSYLLSPFYAVFGDNYIIAGLVLDTIFAIGLILVCRSLLRLLKVDIVRINLFTVITSFIIYPFYRQPYADAIGITLFLAGILFALRICSGKGNHVSNAIGMVISLLICGFSKYLYLPLVVIVPAYLLLKGVVDRSVELKKTGFYSLLTLVICIATLLVYQKSVSGEAVYITEPTRGIFPGNLLSLYPFIPGSLVNLETAGIVTGNNIQPHSGLYYAYQAVNVVLLLIVFYAATRFFARKKFRALTLSEDFRYMAFLVSSGIVALLALLSLRVEKELDYWTYVQEARYFGVIILLIQLSIFLWWSAVKNPRARLGWIPVLLALTLLPDMFRGMIFTANRIAKAGHEQFTWQTEYKLQKFAADIIRKKREETGIRQVVLAGSSDYINNRVALNSHIPQLMETGNINIPGALKTSSPVILLVIIRSDMLSAHQVFIDSGGKEIAGEISGFYFYTQNVYPQ